MIIKDDTQKEDGGGGGGLDEDIYEGLTDISTDAAWHIATNVLLYQVGTTIPPLPPFDNSCRPFLRSTAAR